MTKTAQFIEEVNSLKPAKGKRKVHPNSLAAIAPFRYPKGYTGNRAGKNQYDQSREIAQAIFEGNPEAIYKAMCKSLLSGNAYTFKELAERAYGKLKESKEVTHVYENVPEADLNARLKQLLADLGLAKQIDDARSDSDYGGVSPANGKAKDSELLPR